MNKSKHGILYLQIDHNCESFPFLHPPHLFWIIHEGHLERFCLEIQLYCLKEMGNETVSRAPFAQLELRAGQYFWSSLEIYIEMPK